MGNGTWQPIVNTVKLNSEIGLFGEGNVKVILHHPYEKLLGTFSYGDRVDVEVPPFRAALLEVAFENCASYCLENCTCRKYSFAVLTRNRTLSVIATRCQLPRGGSFISTDRQMAKIQCVWLS